MAAKFPNAIAADKDVYVQKDRAQSTLTGAMTSSSTSFTVVTGSKFTAGQIVTIDNEQILIYSVSGNTINVGYASANNLDGRGYAGTSAASHVVDSLVSGNVVAANHNALADEVKAIETALGASLANITALIPNPLPIASGGTGSQTQAGALSSILGAAPLPIASGGTAATTQAAALTAILGSSAVPVANGGTAATTAATARTSLSAAKSGANSDITSLTALSTPLSVPQGGTGAVTLTGIVQGNGASAQTATAAASEMQYFRRKPNAGATAVYEFAAPPRFVSTDYNFSAQTPGGSLAIGSNTITLSPVPLGVNGTDTLHYLYVSAGTGTAEAVLITGGTAVSGAATGTVIVTCANTHSGAWTIQSASAGIQEAINTGGTYASVYIPAGTYVVYAPINGNALPNIVGAGPGATTIQKGFASGDVFLFQPSTPSAFYLISNLRFEIASGVTDASGYMLHMKGANYGFIENIQVYRVSVGREPIGGIYLEDSLSVFVSRVLMVGIKNGGIGFRMGSAGQCTAKVTDMEIGSFGTTATLVSLSGLIQSSTFQNLYLQGGGNNIAIAVPATGYFNEINFVNLTLDSASGAALTFAMTAGGVSQKVAFTNVTLGSLAYGINVDGTGATAYGWRFVNVHGGSNVATGLGVIYLKNITNVGITNCSLQGATSAAGDNGLYLDGTTSNINITGSKLGFADTGGTGAGQSNYGLVINTGTHTRLSIDASTQINGATAPILLSGTLALANIQGVGGIGNVRPTIASANTLTLSATQFNDVVFISGNTVIKTITAPGAGVPVWDGKRITMIFTHATPTGTDATGNIAVAVVPTTLRALTLVYDLAAAKWYPLQ